MSTTEEEDPLNMYVHPLEEGDYYENTTAEFKREHKQGEAKIEKLPVEIVQRIGKFLSVKDKINTAVTSPSMRKTVRSTLIDLSSFHMGVEDLANFLKYNKDLEVDGITIDSSQSRGSLRPLRKYMENLKKLNIYGNKELDLTELLKCKKLKYCKIPELFNSLPYLINSTKLRTLMIRGDSNMVLELPNLRELSIGSLRSITVNVKRCPSLTKLTLSGGRLNKLKIHNNLDKLVLYEIKGLDYSFLNKLTNLSSLEINRPYESLDLNVLKNLKGLEKLNLNIQEMKGNFTKLKNLEHLTMIMKRLDTIPRLPRKLKWFELTKGLPNGIPNGISFGSLFSLENLTRCNNIETIMLNIGDSRLNLADISSCVTLRNLSINSIVTNLGVIENFPLLTNLELESRYLDSDLDVNLSRCFSLESLYVIYGGLKNLNFLSRCSNLTTLFIRSKSLRDITPLSTCKQIVNLYLDCPNMKDYSPLEKLPHLGREFSRNIFGHVESFTDKASHSTTVMETPD